MKSLFLFGLVLFVASPALADLNICNKTDDKAFVSIGYKESDDWVSEGWWVVAANECATAISGDLQNRYYYIRAESGSGNWTGDYTFCYITDAFSIRGDKNCTSRGYKTGGFFQVDTGEAFDWTQDLTN